MSRADRYALAFLGLVVAVLYCDILVGVRGLYQYDLFSYHMPMKWLVRDVIRHGELPLWNRFYSNGQPMAANPAYEVFYPPQWLIFLPSYELGFQWHILLHFAIAACGMYALLRGLLVRPAASAFGAAVFVVSGPYLSLATKLPILFAFSWMPLALHCVRRLLEEPRARTFAPAALVLAMQLIIGEPTVALQTWCLIAGYLVWRRKWRRDLAVMAAVAGMAFLIASVQLLPALDFTRDSVRSEPFEFRVVANWSMPLIRPLEAAVPSLFRSLQTGNGASMISTMYPFRNDAFIGEMYVGMFVAVLALAGFLTGSRGALPAALILGGSFVLAAGDHTPLLRLLYDAHIFRALRYPEKFILTAGLAIVAWASVILDRIVSGDRRLLRTATAVAAISFAIVLIGLSTAATPRGYFGLQLLRAGTIVVAFAVAPKKGPANRWLYVVAALTVADVCLATRFLVPRMPHAFFERPKIAKDIPPRATIYPEAYWQVFMREPNALSWINDRPPDVYWWMLRNGLSEHLPARYGFRLVLEEDIDRTALKVTDAFRESMKRARTSNRNGDEPFVAAAGATVRLRYRPVELEAVSNTNPIEVLPASGAPRYGFAGRMERAGDPDDVAARIASRAAPADVAYAEMEPFAPALGEVLDVRESANRARIAVRAAGRAFLVMRVTTHRYWSATIDGRPATLIPTDIAFQGLVVEPGQHIVEMRYGNPWLSAGAVISLLALVAIVAMAVRGRGAAANRVI